MIFILFLLAYINIFSAIPYIAYGSANMQGTRPAMEDAECAIIKSEHTFFGIFDGHGGSLISNYCSRQFYNYLLEKNILNLNSHIFIMLAIIEAAHKLNEDSFITEFGQEEGSCIVSSLIKNGYIYTANIGDSRAILCRDGKAVSLTEDHSPNRIDEKKRIEQSGGFVLNDAEDVPRVCGQLAISRAIGDLELSKYVIPTPEISVEKIDFKDEFLLLCCDGIFEDDIDNQMAIDIVRAYINNNLNDKNLEKNAAQVLVNAAYYGGSTDNISVMVIRFTNSSYYSANKFVQNFSHKRLQRARNAYSI